ncbi:MAG: hypothetical protein ACLVF9_10710 [Enterocloster sp.]
MKAPGIRRNEGFTSSSKVNYVARCGSFAGSGGRIPECSVSLRWH